MLPLQGAGTKPTVGKLKVFILRRVDLFGQGNLDRIATAKVWAVQKQPSILPLERRGGLHSGLPLAFWNPSESDCPLWQSSRTTAKN